MTFNLNFFLAAVALLWLPMPYLGRKDRPFTNRARITSATISGAFRAWQNWADLIRAAVGGYALMELSLALEPGSSDAGKAQYIKLGILLVGMLVQTVRFGQGILAPLFYLTGLTAVLVHPVEAGFAILVAWVFGCGTKDPRFVLPIMGPTALVAAYFLGGLGMIVFFNVAIIFLPLGLSLLLQKRLMYVTREPRVSTYQRRRYRVLNPSDEPETKVDLKPAELKSKASR